MIEFHAQVKLGKPISSRALRRSLAFACIFLGVAGCVLPIMPGLPFFILSGRLLGPRDRLLRGTIVGGRRGLRRMRRSRRPIVRRAGKRLTPHWRTFARLMVGAR